MIGKLIVPFFGLCISSFTYSQDITFTWTGIIPPPTPSLTQPIQFENNEILESDIRNIANVTHQLTVEKVPHERTQTEILVLSTNL